MDQTNASNLISDADRDLMNRFIGAIESFNEIRTFVNSQPLVSQNHVTPSNEPLAPQIVNTAEPSQLIDLLLPVNENNRKQRIKETIQNSDKYGIRTISPNPMGEMVKGPNGKMRTPSLAERLSFLIRRLFVDQHGVEPTRAYLEESVKTLRSVARDTYRLMLNDGHSPVKLWGSFSDEEQLYYALLLESFAMRRGINIYLCRKQWAAKGMLSERCKTSKQNTNRSLNTNRSRKQDSRISESQRE